MALFINIYYVTHESVFNYMNAVMKLVSARCLPNTAHNVTQKYFFTLKNLEKKAVEIVLSVGHSSTN